MKLKNKIKLKKNIFLITAMALAITTTIMLSVSGCSQAAKEVIEPEPPPPIVLTATKVVGEDNAFLLTWNGEYNRGRLTIRGQNARGGV